MSEITSSTLGQDTPEEREFELRAAVGSYWTGGRLFIGMFTFLLASEAFAYFYLRSSNSGQLWRPAKITAPTSFGWAIFAIMFASGLLAIYGQWRLRRGSLLDWQVAGWTALAGGVLALVLQIIQLTKLPFFPGSSGYASCFIGWAVMNLILIISASYWLETNLARSHRLGSESLGSSPSAQIFRANVASCTYFWGFAAVASALFWAMFYLI
jgi:heme/copper-type cytochrome/quinol oxidase subunit 3